MFEQLAYDSSSQTQAGVEAILQGSFMYKNNIGYIDTTGKYQTTNTLYSAQIMTAAALKRSFPLPQREVL